MFACRLNELRLTLHLQPYGPLLVKAGETLDTNGLVEVEDDAFDALYGQAIEEIEQRAERKRQERKRRKQELAERRGDPEVLQQKLEEDMRFVTTCRRGQEEPYLPGSSLKGVLRTRCEQLAHTFLPDQEGVCDIFGETSCTEQLRDVSSADRYAHACRICQIFGCGGLAGRLAVSDAYLVDDTVPPFAVRSGVGIDRLRGAAHDGALFFYQVLEQGILEVTVTLESFELWQLGLIGLGLHELRTGALRVGYGARRGLGRLKGDVEDAVLTYFGTDAYADEEGCLLKGAAALITERGLPDTYEMVPEPEESSVLPNATLHKRGLRQQWHLPAAALTELWTAGMNAWQQLIAPEPSEEV